MRINKMEPFYDGEDENDNLKDNKDILLDISLPSCHWNNFNDLLNHEIELINHTTKQVLMENTTVLLDQDMQNKLFRSLAKQWRSDYDD